MHDVATERYVTWVLDRPSWVLRESTGYWHVQVVPDRPAMRVWLCVAVRLTARGRYAVGLVSRPGLRKLVTGCAARCRKAVATVVLI